jgi:hypothetical protein
MRISSILLACLLLAVGAVFAQSDRGTITGTVTDPAGGVIPDAAIEAMNSETGALYKVVSTSTGNYTLAQLPAGTYQISVSAPGFKQYVRKGITVLVAQTLRIDIALEVGNITETVTVNADAPLLRTESGELSQTVTSQRLNELPILSISGGMRTPYAAAELVPGLSSGGSSNSTNIRMQGAPAGTQTLRIEGQDANLGIDSGFQYVSQPSVDAIEEFAISTSNFAAEYGQAGGGVINAAIKSGTNKIHGSFYEYFANEALNANRAYQNQRPRDRKNDYGFTLGGPVYIPGVYDGRDKTFFFFNFEQYRTTASYITPNTIPTAAMRNGDFSAILTGRNLCPATNPNCAIDTQGNPVPIMENAIYDPATETVINGQVVRDPFPNNQIPVERFDPVAAKIQALIPSPSTSSLTNNYFPNMLVPNAKTIPAIKIDHFFSSAIKLSAYWSYSTTIGRRQMNDGLDYPGTTSYDNPQKAHTFRLNYDQTLSPTMLLHFGAGHMHTLWGQSQPEFDSAKQLGLKGTYVNYFPTITGLSSSFGGLFGSFSGSMGANQLYDLYEEKPTANASLTWVRENHTFKFGAELRLVGNPMYLNWPSNGYFSFTAIESGLPSTLGQNLFGGTVGFPYASFLLGAVDTGAIGPPTATRMGKKAWALFAEDSWKVTPKLTIDYGLRWDYQGYLREEYGRVPSISANEPNPATGNLPGGVIFEATSGPFAKVYPYAFGPRLGVAYQITPKTVFRGGWGFSYGQTAPNNFWSMRFGSNVPFAAPAYGAPAMLLNDGVPIQPTWPDFNPGQFPAFPSTPTSFLTMVDSGAGRPPRIMMWSIGLQRQITTNLAVEVAYVGNRGVWWQAGALNDPNRLTPEILAANHLDINKQEDRDLLVSPLNSALAAQRGFSTPPYPAFSLSLPVNQALRPFPQFTGINVLWYPGGNTWYDSLQAKVTKRYSYGLDLSAAYTWAKELTLGTGETEDAAFFALNASINNSLDRKVNKYLSGFSRPHRLVIALNYRLPVLKTNKVLSWMVRDWTYGALLTYTSGMPIRAPYSNNALGDLLKLSTPMNFSFGAIPFNRNGTYANRVQGQPLFTADPNCTSCYDPNKDFLLNPNAWSDPAPGQWGTSAAYYNDYRSRRTPTESMSLGRTFSIGERASLNIRVELNNAFNRIRVPGPSSTNAQATQRVDQNGKPSTGFGYMNTASGSQGRTGQLVARIQF